MAASRLQTELASCARLENKLSQLPAQQIAAGRMLGDSQRSAPHGGAEPLDQPRLPDDQAVSLRRAGERALAADQADADVRRRFRQQLRSGVAEATLIKDEEVETGEVRCDDGELLAQWRLRQAQCSRDGEPVGCDVEEHEGAVIAPAGEIEAGNAHVLEAQVASSMARCFIHGAGFRRGRRAVASNLNKTTEQKQD